MHGPPTNFALAPWMMHTIHGLRQSVAVLEYMSLLCMVGCQPMLPPWQGNEMGGTNMDYPTNSTCHFMQLYQVTFYGQQETNGAELLGIWRDGLHSMWPFEFFGNSKPTIASRQMIHRDMVAKNEVPRCSLEDLIQVMGDEWWATTKPTWSGTKNTTIQFTAQGGVTIMSIIKTKSAKITKL